MTYCFLLFNMFENVLSLVTDEMRFKIFFYKACDLLTDRKCKRLMGYQ